jgi:hypothetical protein
MAIPGLPLAPENTPNPYAIKEFPYHTMEYFLSG